MGVVFICILAIPELNGRFLHNCMTESGLIAGHCWTRYQLRNSIMDVSVTSRPMKWRSSVEGIFILDLAIFYSTADGFTTGGRILIPFVRGCWARCQPSNGIRYVFFVLELSTSLPCVECVLGIILAILYSTADYSTTASRTLMLFAAGCWA